MPNKRWLWIAQLVCAVMVTLVTGGAALLIYGLSEWNLTTMTIIATTVFFDLFALRLAHRIDHWIEDLSDEGRPSDQPN